jgi:hypothetical protein
MIAMHCLEVIFELSGLALFLIAWRTKMDKFKLRAGGLKEFVPTVGLSVAMLMGISTSRGSVVYTTTADAAVSGPDGGGAGSAVNATNLTTGRAGSNNTNNLGRAYIVPFQLPRLTAGQTFTAASFTAYYAASGGAAGAIGSYPDGVNANFDADLYGLGERSSSTVLTSDYFQGSGSGTPTYDTTAGTSLLQHDFMAAGTAPADVSAETTSTAGGTALAAYLNAEYTLGGAGSWVFLRLSADSNAAYDPATASTNGYNYAYNFYTFDQGTVTGTNVIPSISYSVSAVPEPASIGIAAIAGLGLVRRRRAVR